MTLIYGHRGAKGEAPENTLASFQRCLEHGVTRCELDLHLSRDGELMVIHDATLKRINRGHDYRAYESAVIRARSRGLKVCTHLIVGLPGEQPMDSLTTLKQVVQTGTDGIKLHPLHIVEGSVLGKAWQAGRLPVISLEEYVAAAVAMIQHTPPEVVYHRVSASARKPTLLAPEWCENRWSGMVAISEQLGRSGNQGTALGRPFLLQP